jgi:N-acetylmuramoyl-L-alanine amidase
MKLYRIAQKLGLVIAALVMAGCATGPRLDKTYSAVSQDSRVRYLVIHYTALDLPASLRVLTQQAVSSHYLVDAQPDPTIYLLVDESRRAHHAGVSSWQGNTNINPSSIGIEIVNLGNTKSDQGTVYYPFPQSQIDRVIALVRDIVQRHQISPDRVVGHSDIAPQRKQDPGPLFPWKQLADAGLVLWPDAQKVAERRPGFEAMLPDVAWFQQRLQTHGFAVPQTGVLDEPTRTVIAAFQMKYRNSNFDGNPDGETAAILDALTAPPVR